MCCRDQELPKGLTEERAVSLEKVMATPYAALTDLLDKLGSFLSDLAGHPEVSDKVREFVENDLQGWIVAFELDEEVVTSAFERIWSRSG